MVERSVIESGDMGKLMPYHLRRFLAQRFLEAAWELGEVVVVCMSLPTGSSGDLVGRLFVVSDCDDCGIESLQRRVDWIKAEVCPTGYCSEVLGDISVVGPDHILELRERQNMQYQPAVCVADYSGDDSFRDWGRSLNAGLN